ncbi:complex I subunit 5 family protein [Candidatus Desulforudis audaxviator]|uniref:NADH-quinone oxidoreductase subunit N n=1 Tax=Desulforudis audaxviator (strain MP104C) TaxID=477974 RepID=NUON_DESAP|nr:monovalent cation/H+ antiporter subunit D family protein [Candidatus Desulforudis audaxviator]B1I6I5.1 RecName: Full=NADH-quinone oxidoreductase subunit N; AltName: Full=NADH dehydrogenase I subunit N; AltName: Full=NDH-1 subunit N [Candidatus Desulforudis audaxviator MP104C]ACA60648.1 NADH dehydrogenase (quinone) [Candidatus Desulforudis audaxviator MP104C]AZK60731.1 monovalent cation/H+ antiporter subunit D family protein [Candidatus Desulforudis audaxviator]
MTAHLPILIVIIPLFVAMAARLLVRLSVPFTRGFVLAAALAVLASGAVALAETLVRGEPWRYYVSGWPPPWGIELVIDPLAGGLIVLVAFFGLAALVYAGPYLQGRTPREQGSFYALFLLAKAGLLGMCATGDLFNLYVFLEISSLAAYALIAFGGRRSIVAALRYLIIGTAAACFYLLGVGYLYAMTGSLNMADLAVLLPPLMDSPVVILALVFIVAGLGIKMALFPLHGWLPDAYSYTPAPVLAFMAAVMTKVSAYALYRILYFVTEAAGPVSPTLQVLGWMAAAGILFGSIMAIAQRDLWRMLAYSSVAQVGYIVLGLAVGNVLALYGALLHVLSHALVKGGLFFIAGGVSWETGVRRVSDFVGIAKKMPLTMGAFVAAALSMIGLPPTLGFFSKWYLVLGCLEAGAWVFVAVLVVSSLLTAVYFFRVIENAYLKGLPQPGARAERPVPPGARRFRLELPASMLVPILVLGIGVVVLGLFNEQIISNVIQYALPWRLP